MRSWSHSDVTSRSRPLDLFHQSATAADELIQARVECAVFHLSQHHRLPALRTGRGVRTHPTQVWRGIFVHVRTTCARAGGVRVLTNPRVRTLLHEQTGCAAGHGQYGYVPQRYDWHGCSPRFFAGERESMSDVPNGSVKLHFSTRLQGLAAIQARRPNRLRAPDSGRRADRRRNAFGPNMARRGGCRLS